MDKSMISGLWVHRTNLCHFGLMFDTKNSLIYALHMATYAMQEHIEKSSLPKSKEMYGEWMKVELKLTTPKPIGSFHEKKNVSSPLLGQIETHTTIIEQIS